MLVANLIRTDLNEKTTKNVGRVIFDGDRVRFDGVSPSFVETWKAHGILANKKVLTPDDGRDFVVGLRQTLRGPYYSVEYEETE
jgi:hypothetical protein